MQDWPHRQDWKSTKLIPVIFMIRTHPFQGHWNQPIRLWYRVKALGFPASPWRHSFPERWLTSLIPLNKRDHSFLHFATKELGLNGVWSFTIVMDELGRLGTRQASPIWYRNCPRRCCPHAGPLSSLNWPSLYLSIETASCSQGQQCSRRVRRANTNLLFSKVEDNSVWMPNGDPHILLLWRRKKGKQPNKYPRKAGYSTSGLCNKIQRAK